MIELNDLIVQAKDRVILDIPSLRLTKNKRYGIIGENGSGKTTLLRVLAGTITPTQGRIKGIKRDETMGYLPQSPYAFSFSVMRNISMAFDHSKLGENQAREMLKSVGMDHLLHSVGNKLSGGEKQRLGLARVLAMPREILLLDEPSSATDIRGTDIVEALLQDWFARSDGTLIFSTHSPAQALRLSDEILFMEQGKIIEQGSPKELFENPQQEETRSFLSHWRL